MSLIKRLVIGRWQRLQGHFFVSAPRPEATAHSWQFTCPAPGSEVKKEGGAEGEVLARRGRRWRGGGGARWRSHLEIEIGLTGWSRQGAYTPTDTRARALSLTHAGQSRQVAVSNADSRALHQLSDLPRPSCSLFSSCAACPPSPSPFHYRVLSIRHNTGRSLGNKKTQNIPASTLHVPRRVPICHGT